MAEIHKCGQGWAYCDGNCTTCAASNYYTTNGTITLVKDYPPYLDYPKQQKKQTNADKYIRNATDEELAKWIHRHDCHTNLYGYDHEEAILDWLKQEAETE